MSQREPFDGAALQHLLMMVNDDVAFVNEMIDAYMVDVSHHMATIKQALVDSNVSEVRRSAHTLKSNSINFGALQLAELARLLEEQCCAGSLSGADTLLAQITDAYEQTRRSLDAARPSQRSCGE